MKHRGFSVLHTVASLDPANGGPTRSVTKLCAALSELPGCEVRIVTGTHIPSVQTSMSGLTVSQVHATRGFMDRLFARAFAQTVQRHLDSSSPQIIHDHGIWLPTNRAIARIANTNNIPLVIHPRGMLEPVALKHRRWKKKVALLVYQMGILRRAAMLFATSEKEYESIRRFGLSQPVALIPNGVDLPPEPDLSQSKSRSGGVRRMLCLARLHKVKGHETLVRSWGVAQPANWELVLAGPDESGIWPSLKQLAKELGVGPTVRWIGEVSEEEKEQVYRDADCFILASSTENFGLAIAEALAYGLPVITTHGTPWKSIETHGCGWWVEKKTSELAKAINLACSATDDERHDMGKQGRALASRFDWAGIARETLAVYKWIALGGSRPDCVRVT